MSDQVVEQLASLTLAIHELEASGRRMLGVSAYEMLALAHLQPGPLLVGDLGRRIALTSGAMTGMIDRLVRAGFVMRSSDPQDGRRVLLHLTPMAHDRVSSIQRPLRGAVRAYARSMPKTERDHAYRLLAGLTETVQSLRTEDPWST